MADKEQLITVFNDRLEKFMEQLRYAFPKFQTDKQALVMENQLKTAIICTPQIPISMFYAKFVLRYDKQIKDRDENFFGELIKEPKNSTNPMQLLIYVYDNATERNKEVIWDYLDQLRFLAVKYHIKKT